MAEQEKWERAFEQAQKIIHGNAWDLPSGTWDDDWDSYDDDDESDWL